MFVFIEVGLLQHGVITVLTSLYMDTVAVNYQTTDTAIPPPVILPGGADMQHHLCWRCSRWLLGEVVQTHKWL